MKPEPLPRRPSRTRGCPGGRGSGSSQSQSRSEEEERPKETKLEQELQRLKFQRELVEDGRVNSQNAVAGTLDECTE